MAYERCLMRMTVLNGLRREPLAELDELRREMDRFFGGALGFSPPAWPEPGLRELADRYELALDVPGLVAGDVEIKVEEGVLRLRAEHKPAAEEGTKDGDDLKLVRKERAAVRVARSFELPAHVDVERIAATLDKGVLTLTVPKSEAARSRTVEVKGA